MTIYHAFFALASALSAVALCAKFGAPDWVCHVAGFVVLAALVVL